MTKHDWIAIAAIIISAIGNYVTLAIPGGEWLGFCVSIGGFVVAWLNCAFEQRGRSNDQA